MSFVRNLIRDLVDKRLWPVALLMLVAIVAIPVLGGGLGGSDSAGEEAVLPVTPNSATSSAVELLGPPSVRKRPGKVVDPFRRKAKPADPATDTTTTVPSAATSTPPTPPTGGTTPPTGGTTSPTTPDKSRSVYRTTVRWGSVDSEAKAKRVSRLTPFGDLLDPALLFLGVERGGKHALFLLGLDATSVGEAGCRDSSCRMISMRPGESQVVDVKPEDAPATQREVTLVSIKREQQPSLYKASLVRAYVHPDGRDVLRLMLGDEATRTAVAGYRYDRNLGVMVHGALSVPSGG